MSMFSRQPSLPPERPSNQKRAVPVGVATPQVMAQFAVVGVDTQTGQPVSTVIEARSENEAQELAQQQGIIVDEFKPMHPLAGAAAVQMARNDPDDRFNQHASYAEHAQGTGTQPARQAPQPQGPPDIQRPLIDGPSAETMGQVRQPKTSPLGGVAVLGVVGALGFLLYSAMLKDGGARDLFALLATGPQSAEASIDISEPLGVDWTEIQGFEDWQYVNDLADPISGTDAAGSGDAPAQAPAGPTLRLEAIIPPTSSGGGHRGSAVIGGRIIRPGGEVGGYRLVLVRDKHVLLQKGDKLVALRMSKSS